jgi:uncharacterized Fe-S cluster protein YjdI
MVTFNKHYSNGEIVVHWKPDICVHSGNCARQLLQVFNPRVKPWINIDGGRTDEIIRAVDGCPSGALSWERENNTGNGNENEK